MLQEKILFKNTNNGYMLSANIYKPENFTNDQKYPALVIGHPAGGVKEQTAGVYAKKMAEVGFITIAFDATYQGESEGLPMFKENPYDRVDDFSAAVDYLTTLPFVDTEKIGGVGICASGGYLTAATKKDHRIKALVTVNGVDIGEMFYKGWMGTGGNVDIEATLNAAETAKTAEANGAEPTYLNWVGERKEEYGKEATDGYDYYRTPRAQHPNSTSAYLLSDMQNLLAFKAFDRIEQLLTQPLLVVAGAEALSRWNSEYLFANAASKNKELFMVENANHFDLYDINEFVDQAITKMKSFFESNL